MLVETDSNIDKKLPVIYVRLLHEGVNVFRPVPAKMISDSVYLLKGEEIFDPDDETWEFCPGNIVNVIEEKLESEQILLAVSQA